MRKFKAKEKENLLFFKILNIVNEMSLQPLKANEFCNAMMPFWYEKNNISRSYNRISRYLFDYWDKTGEIGNNETAFKKLSVTINAIDFNSESFKRMYRNNVLVHRMKATHEICDEIIKTLQNEIASHHIREIPIRELRSFVQAEEYDKFLFSIVKYVFCKPTPVFLGQEELLSKLNDYKITPNELLEYSKCALMEIGNNDTFSLLSTLRKAGFPGQINRDCDNITLLRAADIFFFHRLTDGIALDSKDIEYSYAYSNA